MSIGAGGGARSLGGLLAEGVVVCDGAMGTMLHAAGVPLGRALAELNLSRPELVGDLHRAYVQAGARILQTNTYGANGLRLAGFGLDGSVSEINIAGARLAREAAQHAEQPVLVAGSIGPATGFTSSTARTPSRARAGALREQISVLTDWVDLLMLETFGDLESLIEAVEVAAQESDLPVVAQLTFGDDGRTLRGEHPAELGAVLGGLDLAAVGANCTVGPAALQGVIADLARSCPLPLIVQPNAGLPQRLGAQLRYARNAEYFGRAAAEFVERGASIIGGCCGTSPAHVRAIAAAVAQLRPPRPSSAMSVTTDAAWESAPARLVAVPPSTADRPARWPPEDGFVVVAGLQVPRGHDVTGFVEQAARLCAAGADLLAIIDPAPPSARVNPVGAGVVLHERVGVDVMLPMETADRNLPTLQADLLGAHALGLRTVVCRTGNPRVAGDYPQPIAPWEVDSVGLIAALSGLNHGVDWRGVPTTDPTSFSIGGSISPSVSDTERELDRAQDKVRAGAHFLVTDVIYDVEGAVATLAALRARGEQITVIASVAPFVDVRTVEWLLHEVPGFSIPPAALAAARIARDTPERAVDAAVSAVEKLREFVAGVLVYLPAEPAVPTSPVPTAPVPAVELITALARLRSPR